MCVCVRVCAHARVCAYIQYVYVVCVCCRRLPAEAVRFLATEQLLSY